MIQINTVSKSLYCLPACTYNWPLAYLLQQVNGGLEVEAKVYELPLDALPLVLLLLQDEHGVVEELLQLLIGVVDAQLLEGVHLEGQKKHASMKQKWEWIGSSLFLLRGCLKKSILPS